MMASDEPVGRKGGRIGIEKEKRKIYIKWKSKMTRLRDEIGRMEKNRKRNEDD